MLLSGNPSSSSSSVSPLSYSFLLLWSAVLIMYPTTLAVIALTFANYVLQPAFQNCLPPYIAVKLLAAICICESSQARTMLLFWSLSSNSSSL